MMSQVYAYKGVDPDDEEWLMYNKKLIGGNICLITGQNSKK